MLFHTVDFSLSLTLSFLPTKAKSESLFFGVCANERTKNTPRNPAAFHISDPMFHVDICVASVNVYGAIYKKKMKELLKIVGSKRSRITIIIMCSVHNKLNFIFSLSVLCWLNILLFFANTTAGRAGQLRSHTHTYFLFHFLVHFFLCHYSALFQPWSFGLCLFVCIHDCGENETGK